MLVLKGFETSIQKRFIFIYGARYIMKHLTLTITLLVAMTQNVAAMKPSACGNEGDRIAAALATTSFCRAAGTTETNGQGVPFALFTAPHAPPVRAAVATVAKDGAIAGEREEHGNVGTCTTMATKRRRTLRIEDSETSEGTQEHPLKQRRNGNGNTVAEVTQFVHDLASTGSRRKSADSEAPVLEACGSTGSPLGGFGLSLGNRRKRRSRALIVDNSSDDENDVATTARSCASEVCTVPGPTHASSAASTAPHIAGVAKNCRTLKVMVGGLIKFTRALGDSGNNRVKSAPVAGVQPHEETYAPAAPLVHGGPEGAANGNNGMGILQTTFARHYAQGISENSDTEVEEDDDYVSEDGAHAHLGSPVIGDEAPYAGEVRDSGAPRFVCEYGTCSYATDTRSRFIYHQQTHNKNRPFECSQKCGFRSKYKQDVARHEAHYAGEKQHYGCHLCFLYTTADRPRFDAHIAAHSTRKRFACSECAYQTRFKADLEKHIRHAHMEVKTFACPYCTCSFSIRGYLMGHLFKEHGTEENVAGE